MKNSLYERFSPAERAGLYDAALVRKDPDEAQLLLETCPRKLVTVRDPAFVSAVTSIAGELLAPKETTTADIKSCPQCAIRAANGAHLGPALGFEDESAIGKLLRVTIDAVLIRGRAATRQQILDAIAAAHAVADDAELLQRTDNTSDIRESILEKFASNGKTAS